MAQFTKKLPYHRSSVTEPHMKKLNLCLSFSLLLVKMGHVGLPCCMPLLMAHHVWLYQIISHLPCKFTSSKKTTLQEHVMFSL